MGSIFGELCGWEVRVRLGWLPMTRRHLDWITLSLSERVFLLWGCRMGLHEYVSKQRIIAIIQLNPVKVLYS